MKGKKDLVLFIALAFFFAAPAFAWKKKPSITITAQFDPAIKSVFTSFEITILEHYSSFVTIGESKSYRPTDSAQSFQQVLLLPSKTAYLTVDLRTKDSFLLNYGLLRGYLVHDGDQINCQILKNTIVFTGKGAERLNLQTRLFELAHKNQDVTYTTVTRKDDRYFEKHMAAIDQNFEGQMEYLNQNRSSINREVYDYLVYQCLGWKNLLKVHFISTEIKKNFPGFPERAKSYYRNHLQELNIDYPDIVNTSTLMLDFIYLKEKLDFELDNSGSVNRTGAGQLLNRLDQHYVGNVREGILIRAINDLSLNYTDAYSSIKMLKPFAKNSTYYKLFSNMIKSMSENAKPYPFVLPDSSGKMIRPSDFLGKVLILDFWFTGCQPCQMLKKDMESIVEHFKGKDVAFATISIDRNREHWAKSLKQGNYTHKGSIDLYTNGKGNGHPILAHYNIGSYPKVLIFNKLGRLVTAEPVRPIDEASAREFIHLIEAQL